MDLRDVLHHLIDGGGGRWADEDGRAAHEAVDRHFVVPDPPALDLKLRGDDTPEAA